MPELYKQARFGFTTWLQSRVSPHILPVDTGEMFGLQKIF